MALKERQTDRHRQTDRQRRRDCEGFQCRRAQCLRPVKTVLPDCRQYRVIPRHHRHTGGVSASCSFMGEGPAVSSQASVAQLVLHDSFILPRACVNWQHQEDARAYVYTHTHARAHARTHAHTHTDSLDISIREQL